MEELVPGLWCDAGDMFDCARPPGLDTSTRPLNFPGLFSHQQRICRRYLRGSEHEYYRSLHTEYG